MEVESTLSRLQGRSYSHLEVVQHSYCLLVFCCIVGFFCFAVCLAVGMAAGGSMAGFWLYIFIVFGVAGLICWSVVGWQFYLVKREKDDAHTRAKAEVRLLNKTATLVDDAIKHGDTVNVMRNEDKGITDVKVMRSAVLLAQAQRGRVSVQAVDPLVLPSPDEEPIPVPVAPRFWDIIDLITEERMPLCFVVDTNPRSCSYGQTVPAFGTILDLLSLCVIGKPGRGKSVLLLYYLCILAKYGSEVHILDPQGAFKDLMLLHGKPLPAMPPTACIYYYSDIEEMEAAVSNVFGEIKVREKLYKPHMEDGEFKQCTMKHPLVIMADELPILAEMDVEIKQRAKEANKARKEEGLDQLQIRQVTNMVKTAVLAARKYGVYFVGASQSIDATILPTRVSAGFNSRIVFYSEQQKARMAGLESDVAKRLLPVIRRAGPGMTIYDCGRWDTPLVAAFPNITIEDVLQFFGISMEELKALWIVELTAQEGQGHIRVTGPLADAPHIVQSKKVGRRATLVDAIEVWNESPTEMGRPRLREVLQGRGLECSDDLAKTLLKGIKQRLDNAGGAGG